MSGSLFLSAYPAYANTGGLDELRAREYPYLDARGHVYLDYAGAGLPSRAQIEAHADRLRDGPFGTVHSSNPTASAANALIDRTRAAILSYFNASPEEYAVVFTPNTTAACRLVGEAYPFEPGSRLVLTADSHNAVHGLRTHARARGATPTYLPLDPVELRVSHDAVRASLGTGQGLFAFPAQSGLTGVRHPLSWIQLAQAFGYDVMLDAAAFVPANRLDLGAVHPDFVAVSWYKVFGYPTGVCCLLARWEALARLRRPWAATRGKAGGALGDGYEPAANEAAFEEGTLNFLAIPDVTVGLAWVEGIGLDVIRQRVGCLTGWLLDRLHALRHDNGAPLIRLYGPWGTEGRGATVALNVLTPDGDLVDERLVGREAAARNISVRTGNFCEPGADEVSVDGPAGARLSIDDYLAALGMPVGGVVRVSLGLVSNLADVEAFVRFVAEAFLNRTPDPADLRPRLRC